MATLIKSYINAADEQSPLDIHPVAGRIGAEIRGVNLSNVDDATLGAIRIALAKHKVIFFRDQNSLSDHDQEEFAARFGEPVAHPTVPVAEGSRYLLDLDSKEGFAASSWHTDVTFVAAYPKISVLRALIAPEAGGDTLWANTATAYDGLPEQLKGLVDGLWAIHSNDYDYAETFGRNTAQGKEHRAVFTSTVYETEHPVVHVHPETGERHLLLGHFFKRFVDFNDADSQRLYSILQDHITRPENTVRWRWRAGDVAVWDNRATQHRAIADFGLQRRSLRRATIAGETPVSINGRHSQTINREPS